MEKNYVRDLMLPIMEYPKIDMDATLYDALIELDRYNADAPKKLQPYRAILVIDKSGKIIGKVGHFAILKALEPKYSLLSDIDKLAQANLSSDFIESIMDHYKLWESPSLDLKQKAKSIIVKDAMRSVSENIDEKASIAEAIHKLIMWQSLSILVTSDNNIVGILRLSDLIDEIIRILKNSNH